jgi:hypothetical protein
VEPFVSSGARGNDYHIHRVSCATEVGSKEIICHINVTPTEFRQQDVNILNYPLRCAKPQLDADTDSLSFKRLFLCGPHGTIIRTNYREGKQKFEELSQVT